MATFDIRQLQTDLADKKPRIILKKALELFDNIAIALSGAEDVALIDMAVNIRKDIQVFCLDT
jgi:phosphoadenosine phosphosulfate reductase